VAAKLQTGIKDYFFLNTKNMLPLVVTMSP